MSGYTEIALLQYELEKLRAELAKKDAKIERLKTVPMMYILMAFNAQLQDENNELQQQLEAKDAELSNYKRATDLAYNGSELETRQQLASAQADNDQLRAELAALKAENATAWAQAHRLAIELECLLLDTKDNATVSKWWDSGMEALDEYQRTTPGAKEDAEAWAKMRKEML